MDANTTVIESIDEMLANAMSGLGKPIVGNPASAPAFAHAAGSYPRNGADGCIFDDVDRAVKAAADAHNALMKITLAERGEYIEAIRDMANEYAPELARLEVDETGMGCYEHKIRKIMLTVAKTPGIEDIKPEALAGDYGLTIIERFPFGVACCITPSTGPSTTAIHNSICMIAAGNSAVFSPHPNAIRTSNRAVELINDAVVSAGGPKNLVTSMSTSAIPLTQSLVAHPGIGLVVATGGPNVVKMVLSSGKRAIGAGPGNPPVLVDETADLRNAARSILQGNSFENGIQCIGEKEIIVVESVADAFLQEIERGGAYILRDRAMIDRLTKLVTREDGSQNKDYVGKSADFILKALGVRAENGVKSIVFEAPKDHIIVVEEYLMPLLPVVRCKDVDEGIRLAVACEGGRRHTAVIHSKNVSNMTRYARALSCTILVKNGPSFAGLGLEGEGYMASTVAGPTGEGITSPRSFTRIQRCSLIGDFNLRAASI